MAKGARRVVTGSGADGGAVFVSDGMPPTVAALPGGGLSTEMWRSDGLPADLKSDGTPSEYIPLPPEQGLVFRIAELQPEQGVVDEEEHGMHGSVTLDFIVIISGEVWHKIGPGPENERLLKPGDTLIQRGARHAWRKPQRQPLRYGGGEAGGSAGSRLTPWVQRARLRRGAGPWRWDLARLQTR